MAAHDHHTVMICPAAMRTDTNNMFRGLTGPDGLPYDASPVDSVPGTFSAPLATTLNAKPWETTPTHYMASAWELPTYEALMADLKAGNVPTRDWLPYNLNQLRARRAGEELYTRTQPADGRPNGAIVQENITAALAELGLQRIPVAPRPEPIKS